MALSSMTGFARGHGVSGAYSWAWELKSVNAKGLDLRLRLPPGWDVVEGPARHSAAQVLARGTVHGMLTVERLGVAPVVRVNEPVLAAVLATIKGLAGRVDATAPRLDGILSLKGVIEVIDEDEREEDRRVAEAAEAAPGRRPEAIKARIVEQVAMLLDASDRFDPDRLHQEAILIASKADIREELDRLASHVAQI